jgi:hypothetical protein
MDKAAIDIANALVWLSELTIFELRGEWRRLHRMPPPMRLSRVAHPRHCDSNNGTHGPHAAEAA